MRVDMSPAAVTARLQTLDELWELSVELMRAKPQQGRATGLSGSALTENSDTRDADQASPRVAEVPRNTT
jgi:hypothetical protein